MVFHKTPWWSLLSVLALLLTTSARADTERYSGMAYDAAGRVLYREQHEVVQDSGRLSRTETTYFDPQGKMIGRLQSDYSRSVYAPTYSFIDLRTGKRESARFEGESFVLRSGDRERRYAVSNGEVVVLGQGMHHFVRENLTRIAEQGAVVRFGIPSRLEPFRFRIRRVGSPSPGVIRLRIESDSWLLRVLSPFLEVDYEMATRHLLRYEGVSNLEGPHGETQNVVIVYDYRGGA